MKGQRCKETQWTHVIANSRHRQCSGRWMWVLCGQGNGLGGRGYYVVMVWRRAKAPHLYTCEKMLDWFSTCPCISHFRHKHSHKLLLTMEGFSSHWFRTHLIGQSWRLMLPFVHFEFLSQNYFNWLHNLYIGKWICTEYIPSIFWMKIQAFVEMQK